VTDADPALNCYYSLNGGTTWNAMGAVATTNARLIAADTDNRVYCQPGLNLNGTFDSALTFRAWDRTSGTDGGTANTTVNGGITAFSIATNSIRLVVTAVNDAPIRTGAAATLAAVLEDTLDPAGDSVASLLGGLFSDADGTDIAAGGVALIANAATAEQGTWQFRKGGGAFTDFPALVDSTAVILLGSNDFVRFVPAENFNGSPGALTARLWDGTGGFSASDATQNVGLSNGGSSPFSDNANEVTLGTTISPVNDPPSFAPFSAESTAADENPQTHGPALQKMETGWVTGMSAGAPFETGQKLSYLMTNNNNGLFTVQPQIDSQGNLTYTPKPNARGTATVTVTLKDDAGGDDTSTTQQFQIVITKTHRLHNAAQDGTRIGLDVTGSTSSQPDGFIVAGDVLAIVNYINANGSGHVGAASIQGPPYCDVNGDDEVAAQDALMVINYINAHPGQSEGESTSAAEQPAFSQASDLMTLLAQDMAETAVRRRRTS